ATGDGAAGTTGAIQRSQDAGRSWQALDLPAVPNSPIWAFATHAADPGRIVACSHYGEVYMTENAGDFWTKLPREFTEIRALAWLPN
ncbi:MAG TPA: glycosyl hydrolase, partial [Stellaceae bacterium]